MSDAVLAAAQKLLDLIDRQQVSGLITRDLIRAANELRLAVSREQRK